jgi:hypothetical protein
MDVGVVARRATAGAIGLNGPVWPSQRVQATRHSVAIVAAHAGNVAARDCRGVQGWAPPERKVRFTFPAAW